MVESERKGQLGQRSLTHIAAFNLVLTPDLYVMNRPILAGLNRKAICKISPTRFKLRCSIFTSDGCMVKCA